MAEYACMQFATTTKQWQAPHGPLENAEDALPDPTPIVVIKLESTALDLFKHKVVRISLDVTWVILIFGNICLHVSFYWHGTHVTQTICVRQFYYVSTMIGTDFPEETAAGGFTNLERHRAREHDEYGHAG
jgi:hypothetical protein